MKPNKNILDQSVVPRSEYYQNPRHEMTGYIPDSCMKILEIGCGEGDFSRHIKVSRGAEVWGIELSKNAADKAMTKIDKVIVGSVEDSLDLLPDKYFDCVIFNDVLEHLVDPYSVLEKIHGSILVDKGYVVSSIPNVRHIRNLKELILDKDWRYRSEGILDFTHLRFFTQKSIIRMFESVNFDVLTCEGIRPALTFKVKVFMYLTFNYFEDTKYLQFATVARKND